MNDIEPRNAGFRLWSLLGVKAELARRLAPLGIVVLLLLALVFLWGAWKAFDWINDREAVEDAANEANAEFQRDKDEAAGRADVASGQRAGTHTEKIKRTEELIDEALENDCVVADYLASDGTLCLRPPGVSRPAAE